MNHFQASETHKEVCLPPTKPDDCSDDSWTKIKTVFEGEACRTGRLDDHVNFPQAPQGPGHKVDVVHRPGVEVGKNMFQFKFLKEDDNLDY